MLLEGSCHCGAVRYSVDAPHPYPFNLCYCQTCRKTAGGGGYAINLGARAASLEVVGREHIGVYRPAHVETPGAEPSPQERHFCRECGTALWVQDPRWPDLVHPHASSVDTELPQPPDRNHLMLDFKAAWVPVHKDPQDKQYPRYPDETIAEWHAQRGL